MHYDDSALRRSLDEPEADAGLDVHIATCETCRVKRSELAANASFAARVLGDFPQAAAFVPTRLRAVRKRRPAWLPALAAAGAAAVLVLACTMTPLGGYASQLLTVFEPQRFVPLEITAADSEQLRLMPDLTRFGSFSRTRAVPQESVATLAGIDRKLGFVPRAFDDSTLAERSPSDVLFRPASTVSFIFSAAKARAYEARFGRTLPAMPAGLDGTAYTATYGPTLIRVYGQLRKHGHGSGLRGLGDAVTLVESKAPRVTTSGAPLDVAASYLLALPNVPANVAAQLRAISDPAHTLPVPFVFDQTKATPVDVDGVRGMSIGDETGLGSAVMWMKDGVVYVIAGPLKESEAIALAGRLK